MTRHAWIPGILSLLLLAAPALAQDQDSVFTWDNGTELSFVSSSGNASSSTLGLKSTLEGQDPINTFNVEMEASQFTPQALRTRGRR